MHEREKEMKFRGTTKTSLNPQLISTNTTLFEDKERIDWATISKMYRKNNFGFDLQIPMCIFRMPPNKGSNY